MASVYSSISLFMLALMDSTASLYLYLKFKVTPLEIFSKQPKESKVHMKKTQTTYILVFFTRRETIV